MSGLQRRKEVSAMAENNFTITTGDSSGDTSMVQQYLDTFRRSEHLEPEKSLLAAILEDAIQEYRKYSRSHDANGKKRFREAEEWIMRGGNDWIFSFDNVCDLLALDPEYVRRGLRETLGTPRRGGKVGAPRQNAQTGGMILRLAG
jgi:hypothetical protein